jgi:acetyl esterase
MNGGMPEMSDAANLELGRRHGIPVVSASYRLAPEDPFPAGVDDGVAVARWLLDNGGKAVAEGGFGALRIVVGGESAGGYLAAAVLLRIRDELGAIDRAAGANLVYGIYDWGRSPSHLGLRVTDGPMRNYATRPYRPPSLTCTDCHRRCSALGRTTTW